MCLAMLALCQIDLYSTRLIIIATQSNKLPMVDCDYFTQLDHLLVIESNRILLDSTKYDYVVEIPFPNQDCRKIGKISSNNFTKKTPIKAVYGVVDMEVNKYLVVITKATVIGQIYHRKVFQVQKVDFICLNSTQSSKDKVYIEGLRQILESKHIYFSDEYDLTNSLQTFINNNSSMRSKRLQYMYNGIWVEDFIKIKAYEWITGFISGFVSISFTHTGISHACELGIITRRDKRRQGLRWLTRGSDLDGNTANTAETQVFLLAQSNGKQQIFSYVQLRGSMPFIWKQTPDFKWSPKCTIDPNDKNNTEITKKNYQDIKKYYENCSLLNLIDKKGTQKRMGEYFERMHNSVGDPNMKLVWFDFHAECKNMKYENLSKLLDICSKQVQNYGYFHVESQASSSGRRFSKINTQKGVFRTNCMDCLDRTNVVQSVIARQILLQWLSKLGVMTKSRNSSAFQKLPDSLEQIFRVQWTNNADILSILYSGTPAMKTDFTATGKRTMRGSVKDGETAVKRFFLGHFYDNRKQDFIDFSLGKIKPSKNTSQRIKHSAFNALYALIGLIILIPLLVHWKVDQSTHHESPRFIIKIGVTIVAILLLVVGLRFLKPVLLRHPIKGY